MPARFANDNFAQAVGTTLSGQAATSGGSWSKSTTSSSGLSADMLVRTGNKVRNSGSATQYLSTLLLGTPLSVNQSAIATFNILSLVHYEGLIVNGIAGSGVKYAGLLQPSGSFLVQKYDSAGTATTVSGSPTGSAVSGFAVPSTHTIRFERNGSVLSFYVDGSSTSAYSVTDASPIATVGQPGIISFSQATPSDSTGIQFSAFDTLDPLLMVASPTTLVAGSGPQTVSLTGTGFAVGTSAQFAVSGGTGSVLTSPNATTTTAATVTIDPGSAAGTLLVTGPSSQQVSIAVSPPVVAPTAPAITFKRTGSGDVITLPAASTPGSAAIASYKLYKGTTSGGESGTALATLAAPGTFPASFAPQTAPTAGQNFYYYVKAFDGTNSVLSAASNEVHSATSALSPSGVTTIKTFEAPYGVSASGLTLGYSLYDATGAVLAAYTTSGVIEIAGTGIYVVQIALDNAYSGVIVWDAPGGSGPVTDAFDVPGSSGGGATQSQVQAIVNAGVNVTKIAGQTATAAAAVAFPATIGTSVFAGGAVASVTSPVSLATGEDSEIAALAAQIAAIPAAVLDLANGVETGLTMRQALRLFTSILAGKATDVSGTYTTKRADGTTTALTVVHDALGNRSSITFGTL